MVWFLKANTNDDGLRKANLIKRLSGSSFVTHLVCWSAVFCWACMSKAATGSTEFYKHYYQVSFLRQILLFDIGLPTTVLTTCLIETNIGV